MTDLAETADLVSRLLITHGPLATDEIVSRLRADGVAVPAPVVQVEMFAPVGELVDGRWAWLPAVLAGRVFTHRLTAEELTHDLLTVSPDLDAITRLCEYPQYEALADGTPLRVVMDDYDDDDVLDERGIPPTIFGEGGALLLPSGALSEMAVSVGDIVGVRLSDAGLVVERVPAVDTSTDVAATLTAALNPDSPTSPDSAVWTMCLESPTLFTSPLPPLADIIADAGLQHDVSCIAPPGFDIPSWRSGVQSEFLAQHYGLAVSDAVALQTLVGACEQLDGAFAAADLPDGDSLPDLAHQEDLVDVGSALSNPLLAVLVLDETVGHGVDPAALARLAEMLEPRVSRGAKTACRWLRAAALEHMGDVEDAEREYLAAESMDTEFWPTLLDLARFASDRGDAERGLALLRRAGAEEDDPLFQLLLKHRATPRADVGRNDACWCGSGRKYKKCHLGNDQLPLRDRAAWLYSKACQHVFHSPWTELLDEVTDVRGEYDDPEALEPPSFDDPLPIDVVLFEGGAFGDFLAKRGALLPDDERLLAEQWLLVDRSVFEVEQVHRGRSVTVRDVRTGDVDEVAERVASGQLKAGQLICARVLPIGDGVQFFGGIEPLALHDRNPLVELLDSEPDPVELVEFLTRRFAPPTLVNTEGDLLMMCEATFRIKDAARLVTALDDAFDRITADGSPVWCDQVTNQGMERVRATMTVDADTLTVTTNSEAQMDRVLESLSRLDASLSLTSDTRTPLDDFRKLSPTTPSTATEPDDPEVAAALDVVVRGYEAAWLDQRIPALDGYTPRQAAADPTRRGDVVKLLDGFPGLPGGMNADRLRTALGL
ncbi:SEC-C metal-binding domain-containing protein [Mycolicibacterium sediminis]|uniref:Zinc-binding protein n=1 Tax=Mycolicibacterium sediminis TaxID=1286180 RepID=A0A7I7QPL7_9MYCO|nr:SEC-C metal-binding domain-containing protein [Mycolicibacterium sediminis]BBY28162.1 hypothetical protein MSEDJ_22580 [Mycolicibacterium sediminis]